MTDTLTITRPDDWHLHVRDGAALRDVVPHTARRMVSTTSAASFSPLL